MKKKKFNTISGCMFNNYFYIYHISTFHIFCFSFLFLFFLFFFLFPFLYHSFLLSYMVFFLYDCKSFLKVFIKLQFLSFFDCTIYNCFKNFASLLFQFYSCQLNFFNMLGKIKVTRKTKKQNDDGGGGEKKNNNNN